MPFIGNQPALSYTSFAKQDFTTSATTSYTLNNPVANANELALFINFVRQEPTTAYSASGTSLTLTEATSASDDMYAIFLGKAIQTVTPPSGSVTNAMLVDNAVTNAKIADGAIDNAALSSGSFSNITGVGTLGDTSIDGSVIINESGADKDFRVEGDGDTDLLFVDASADRVGISTNSPGRTLDIAGQLRTTQSASGSQSSPNFEVNGGGYSGFHYLDTEAYYIGQNSQARNLRIYSGNNSGDGVNLSPNGNSWGTYSDERLKKDITDLTNGLDKISAIRPVNFKYKTDADDYRNRIGIIAQSLVGQVDEALDQTKRTSDDDTLYYNVRYQDLIPVLVKALQETKTEIDNLKTRIQTLENN